MRCFVLAVLVVMTACGGGAEEDEVAAATRPAGPAPEADAKAGADASDLGAPAAESGGLPLRTIRADAVPDPCALLSSEDARELLGEPVGPPRRPDAGGYPCVYWGESGESQIVLDMSLARGAEIEDTQLAISLEYCRGEAVAEVDGLGHRAALFRMGKEECGSDTFWVSTGIYFEATERPQYSDWIPKGYIHFTFSLRPPAADDVLVDRSSTAAERALARLPG